MPGSLDSSEARSSIAPTLERQLEGEVQPTGELAHLAFREIGRLFLGLVDGDKDEVLQHLDVLWIGDTWIDFDAGNGSFAVGLDGDHSASRRSGNGLFLEVRLHLLHARLHLLRLLEDLAEISHWRSEW